MTKKDFVDFFTVVSYRTRVKRKSPVRLVVGANAFVFLIY